MKRKILMVLFTLAAFSYAQAQNYQLHSVFIYSFTKYIQWPPERSTGDFVIGVMGDSPIIVNLEKMAESRKAGTRDIVIKKLTNLGEVSSCHILFVPNTQKGMIAEANQKSKAYSTLVVTETDGALAMGSSINFIVREGKLGFELSQSAMSERNLKPSNELTRLAIF
jgi:hypothetical protein